MMCILFSSDSQSYSMGGFGGKKAEKEMCTIADLSGKGKVGAESLGQEKG